MRRGTMRLLYRLLVLLACGALLFLAACASDPPPDPQRQRELNAARAQYEAYKRWYAAQKLEHRMQEWETMRQRADRQMAEKERERLLRDAALRRRWAAYR
jgi:hypothetical protein